MNPQPLFEGAPTRPMSLRDRWCAWRDGLLTSRDFQRWAAGIPWVRWVARRRARAVFDLVAGFVYSQVLDACIRLHLFDFLAEGPQPLAVLAKQLKLQEEQALRLLLAAVSLRLVEHRSAGRFGLGPLGAPLVGNKAVEAMVQHHTALYADLRDPVALLRGEVDRTALGSYWPYAGATASDQSIGFSADRVATYTALMSASQPLVADEILGAYSLSQHRHLLDLGGGDGTFISNAARRYPALRFSLIDLPGVAERAVCRLKAQGLGHRVAVVGASFFDHPLPVGADIVTLVRVIHDHPDAAALAILHAAHRALPAGGTLLVAEPMSATAGAEPMGDAYFGFYLLAMGQGRPRTASELTSLLVQAGFEQVRLLSNRMPMQTRLLVAKVGGLVAKRHNVTFD